MVAPHPSQAAAGVATASDGGPPVPQQQMKQRPPSARLLVALEPEDHFEFALKRCASISGQSIVSMQSWCADSPAAQARRLKHLAASAAAACRAHSSAAHGQQQQQQLGDLGKLSISSKCEPGAACCASGEKLFSPKDKQPLQRCNTCFHSYRFVVTMLGGTSVGLMLLLRFNITIAILQMVNQTHLYLEEHPNSTLDDYLAEGYSLETGEFDWNNEIVAIILAWYMFGYTLPGPLMAKLASTLGCRLAVPLLLATCALSTLLTPSACYLGWEYVVACRLLNGLGASAVIPQLLSLIEKWVRYDEITVGLSLAYLLNATLAAVTPLLCGYLAELHWAYAFYVPALFTLAFCLLWLCLVTDEPHTNWLVSERELDVIAGLEDDNQNYKLQQKEHLAQDRKSLEVHQPQQQQVVAVVDLKQQQQQQQQEFCYESDKPDSWVQIFRVPSFYAYIALWCCYCSSYSGFVFVLPAYMAQFLKIHVSENGFYCFLIQLGCIVSVLWPHQLLKLFHKTLGLSMAHSRVACYALCCSVGAFTWIYVGTQHQAQLAMLFLNRAAHPGNDVLVTSCLMANYAKAGLSGHAFAVVNTLGNFSIVLSSTFIGWLLDHTGASPAGWCAIFVALGSTQLLMFVIFATCVSAEPVKFKNKQQRQQGATNC